MQYGPHSPFVVWEYEFPPWWFIGAGKSGTQIKEGTIPVRNTVFATRASNKPTKPGWKLEIKYISW